MPRMAKSPEKRASQ